MARQDKKRRDEKTPGLRAPEPQRAKKFGLKIDMPRFDEPSEAEQLARALEASTERPRTPDVRDTPSVRDTSDVQGTRDVPATSPEPATARTAPPVRDVRRTPDVPATPRVLVDDKAGYLEVPHWLSDNLLPQLEPFEQVVYYRLYRLSHGFGRDWCVIGTPALERVTKIKHTALFTTIKKLEERGLIERQGQVVLARRGGQGNRYHVNLPVIVPSTSGVRATPGVRRTRDVPGTPAGDMKEKKEDHEKTPDADAPASVYEIRTIAARLFEAHRGALGFDHDRLRELVRDAMIGQGRAVDHDAIEDAIRGMAE
jgi:hypothetical protein